MENNKKSKNIMIYVSTILLVGVFIVSLIFILMTNNKDVNITFYSPITNNKNVVKVTSGSLIDGYLTEQEIDGYEFVGWFYDNNLSLKVEKGSRFSKDHTLFAGYSKIITKTDNSFINTLKTSNIENFITIKTANENCLNMDELLYISTLNLTYINIKDAKIEEDIIREEYFSNSLKLEKITLGSSIKTIAKYAFSGCINLKDIEMSEGLEVIEDNAFSNCLQINNINIPNSVKSLGNNIFSGCKNIKEIKIPDMLETIENKTFFNSSINSLSLEKNNNFKIYNDCLYSSDLKILYYMYGENKNVYIHENTININDFAGYANNYIEKLILNSNLEKIGVNSFKNCKNLKTIVFTNCLDYTIYEGAFENCVKLEELNFSLGLNKICDFAFKGCEGLRNVVFNLAVGSNNKNITNIGISTFENCKNLEKFDFPTSINEVGEKAFYGCSSLKDINISSGIKELKDKTFAMCFSLKNVNLAMNSQLEKIGNYVFEGCKELTSINFEESLKELGVGSFKGCENINNINITNVEGLPDRVFYGCSNLANVTYNKLESIGNESFANCLKLKEIKINPSLNLIEKNAFDNCTGLEKFILSEESDYFVVEEDVLYNKEKTKLLYYPINKSDITEFEVYENLESIEDVNFFYNQYIESFIITGENSNFSVLDGNLYNKDGSKLIKFANSKNQENVLINVKEIGEFAFVNNKYIKNLELVCEKIKNGCLTNMNSIESLVIPFLGESLENKEKKYFSYLFNGISYLDTKKIPRSLKSVKITEDTEVYKYSFYNVKNIEKIEFDKATIINKYAFYNCDNLKNIIINRAVEKFDEYSIYNLKSLETISFGFATSLVVEKNAFGEITNSKIYVYLSNNGYVLQNNQINFIKEKIYAVYNKANRWIWGNK